MNHDALIDTARALVADGRGLLAADESPGTCDKRLAAAGIEATPEARRAWRELLLTAPGLGEGISGVILHEETLRQSQASGLPFVRGLEAAGVLVGIKVDSGARALAAHPGETVTEGLDGLRERLHTFLAMGARFAKWRGVIAITAAGLPSPGCVEANAHALARYAALCQEAGLVPVVEPEVLMDGPHTLERCAAVTETMLREVFAQLARQRVRLEALVLKPNMVLPGALCTESASPAQVAAATLQTLLRTVPAAVAGIAFLSGGQAAQAATAHLNAMHLRASGHGPLPWPLTFSFARALQQPALQAWGGQPGHIDAAQHALMHRVRCNHAAVHGEYDMAVEAV